MKRLFLCLSLFSLCTAEYFTDPAKEFPLVQGWYKDRKTFYYDFGGNSPSNAAGTVVIPAPLYVPVTGFTGTTPNTIPGQQNISPVIIGDAGYSDLWQIKFVTVPGGYQANDWRDADVAVAQATATRDGPLVNCPAVPLNSSLAGKEVNLTLGWYKNRTFHYFDFGPNSAAAIPIYIVAGTGQHNIIDAIPDDGAAYSAFWQKNIFTAPSGFKADEARSKDAIFKVANIGTPTVPATNNVVNCPVIRTDAAEPSSATRLSPLAFVLLAFVFCEHL